MLLRDNIAGGQHDDRQAGGDPEEDQDRQVLVQQFVHDSTPVPRRPDAFYPFRKERRLLAVPISRRPSKPLSKMMPPKRRKLACNIGRDTGKSRTNKWVWPQRGRAAGRERGGKDV